MTFARTPPRAVVAPTGKARRGGVFAAWRGLRHTRWGYTVVMDQTKTFSVPAMHCGHCVSAVRQEVGAVAGISSVDVDLETKLVTVTGDSLDDAALRAAIEEAGYEAA
jgi:copper chaperone